MQLTIDSNQPLAQVLPVISAIYGVQLVVESDATATPAAAPARKAAPRKASAPRKATPSKAAPSKASAPRKSAAKKTTATARRSGGVDASAIRSWAREQGLTVSERGQLPKSVLTAYTSSH